METLTTLLHLPGIRQREPLYQALENQIRRQISAGELVPGDLIPPESQLAQKMNVSQGTVKQAIYNLVWQGLLYRHQGKGTFVSAINLNNSLFHFFSYGDEEGHDGQIHKETTKLARMPGDDKICKQLKVAPHTELLLIERTGFSEDFPVVVEQSWWIADLVPGLEDAEGHGSDMLYALNFDKFELLAVRAEETLTACACDELTARKLGLKVDSPVVVLQRTTYTTRNRIMEVRITQGRTDKFIYKREIR